LSTILAAPRSGKSRRSTHTILSAAFQRLASKVILISITRGN
jgi:hypothetical protein